VIDFKNEFIKMHGQPDNMNKLDEYIHFVTSYNKELTSYSEIHHVLPSAVFHGFKNTKENMVKLLYEDHIKAHILLFESYNYRVYQRPLYWMANYYKDSEIISNAACRGWVKLKSNDKKYNEWRRKRSEFMKGLSSDEQKRRANIFWQNISEKEYDIFCKKVSDGWTENKRKLQSKKLKEYYTDDNNRIKKSKETKRRYENMSDTERRQFSNKMSSVNNDADKRNKASKSLKKLWSDEDFKNKMKNRKTRRGRSILIKHIDNEYVEEFNSLSDVIKTYDTTPHIIRKYVNTGLITEIKRRNNKICIQCKINDKK